MSWHLSFLNWQEVCDESNIKCLFFIPAYGNSLYTVTPFGLPVGCLPVHVRHVHFRHNVKIYKYAPKTTKSQEEESGPYYAARTRFFQDMRFSLDVR